jgi:hypothetical protein
LSADQQVQGLKTLPFLHIPLGFESLLQFLSTLVDLGQFLFHLACSYLISKGMNKLLYFD